MHFFSKAHVTEKTSSRQTTSRPYDKKNPNRAISEFFFTFNEETDQDKILQLLVPNSKRLGGYTQMDELFSKRYTPREDLTKCYTVLLKKALGRRLFLLGKIRRNKKRLLELNHEVLGGLSVQDPQDTPQGGEKI